jgi:hypothetical protein
MKVTYRSEFSPELGAEVWVRQTHECFTAFAKRETVEIVGSIFRHHPRDVAARGDDSGPRRKRWDNPRNLAPGGGGGECDDRFSSPRKCCATDEIHLTANAGVDPRTD